MDTTLKSQMIAALCIVTLFFASSVYGERIAEPTLASQEQAYALVSVHVSLPEHIGAATLGLVLNKKIMKSFGVVQSNSKLAGDLIEKQDWYVLDEHNKGYCHLRIGEEAIQDGVEGFIYLKEVFDKEGKVYRESTSGLPADILNSQALWYSKAALIQFEQPGLYYGGHLTLHKMAPPDKNGWVTVTIRNKEQVFQELMISEDMEGVDFINVASRWKACRGSDFVTILGPVLNQ